MKRFPKAFYTMSLANLCFFLGNSFFILFPVYLKGMGASESYIGAVNNIDKVLVIAASVTIGALIHRWDRVLLLRMGYGLLIAVYALYLGIASLSWFVPAVRVLHGMGFSLAMILGTTVIFEIVPGDRAAEAIGLYGITGALTNAVSPAIGEFLLGNGVPFKWLFVIAAALAAVSLALAFAMPRKTVMRDNGDDMARGILALYRDPDYRAYSLVAFVFGGGFGVLLTFLPNFVLTKPGLSYSFFFVVYIAVLVVVRFTFIRVVQAWDRAPIVVFMLGAAACMNACFNLPMGMPLLAGTGLLYGLAHGFLYPVLNAHLVGIVQPGDRGKSNALFTATFNGGMMLFAFAMGFLIDATGSYVPAFNVCAVSFAAAALVLALHGRSQKNALPAQGA